MNLITAVAALVICASVVQADAIPKVQIGPGGQLIVGGFDPDSFEHAARTPPVLKR